MVISEVTNYITFNKVFLMAICMPFYVIHSNHKQLNIWDVLAAAVCMAGVTTAYFSDTQLHAFITRNERLKSAGEAVVPVLEEGLWRYSRHPNYFGEQLWWAGVAIFAWNLDCNWAFIGPLVNSVCLGIVTVLVEERMSKQNYRAEAYDKYRKTTSVWIPWFKKSWAGKEKET